MKLPIVIGKNSLGENYVIDTKNLPHLFISYQEDLQMTTIFSSILRSLLENQQSLQLGLSFASKLTKELLPFIDESKIAIKFFHSNDTDIEMKTIDQFIKALASELKKRKLLKKRRSAIGLQPLLVFIDDIFEVIRSANKKTALKFIELLGLGGEHSIHIIAASSGIYKPLLNQLIRLNPALIAKLGKANHLADFDKPLAAELVMNPDGLIFFKERNEQTFTRLFPLL